MPEGKMKTIDELCCYGDVLDIYSQKLLNIEFDQKKLCQEVDTLLGIIRMEQCECEVRLKSEWKSLYQRLRKQDISVPEGEICLATSLVYDCAIAILSCSDDTFYNYEVTGYLCRVDGQNNEVGLEDRINTIVDIVEANQEELAEWVEQYMTEAGGTAMQDADDVPISVKGVFANTSDFVKKEVKKVIKKFYVRPVDLALIEVVLFDHSVIKERNQHTGFVEALIDWKIIKIEKKKNLISSMSTKFGKLNLDGYKSWPEENKKDKELCMEIGKTLHKSMKYRYD